MGFGDWKAYRYTPSMAAAVIFIILFLASTLLHTFHLFRTRTWFFIPLVIGGYLESVGYIGRAVSSQQSPNWTLGPYVTQSTLLLIAPALLSASIYMELGRIIVLVNGQRYSLIRVNWLTKIFVTGDVISFFMQAAGAGILVQGNEGTGNGVILGGLVVQIVFFGLFVCSAFTFQYRITQRPTEQSQAPYIPWRKHMNALYAASVLIMIRSVFRVVEYAEGFDGYLLSTEVFLYIFDALLMLSVMMIFLVIHPSQINCLLGKGKVMTVKGGLSVTEATVFV